MIPFYRAAAQERGTGKMRRQHSHVSRGIDELFPGMAVLIKTALDQLLGTSTQNMNRELQTIVASIRRDFEMSYVPAPTVDPADRERKRVLKEEVGKLVAENEKLQRDLKEFLRREEGHGESADGDRGEDVAAAGVSAEVANEGDVSSGSSSESSETASSDSTW